MNSKSFLDWWPVWTQTLLWVIAGAVAWTKMREQVNGLGKRLSVVEADCERRDGRMESLEKALTEYRGDSQRAVQGLAKVEKGVDALQETINNGNLAIGVQLHSIERSISDKDKETSNRLVRIETVQRIEQKIGPIPTEGV